MTTIILRAHNEVIVCLYCYKFRYEKVHHVHLFISGRRVLSNSLFRNLFFCTIYIFFFTTQGVFIHDNFMKTLY